MIEPYPQTRGEFLERVYWICKEWDASITSWLRTPARNASVGGVPNSKHLLGWAVDLIVEPNDEATRRQIVEDCIARGLWALDEIDHVHVQGRPPGPIT